MSTPESPNPVRISKIAGRFLVFDSDGATFLRRHANINGTLVGTAPQQPTQNIFLGLPIELRPEEADALVYRKVAYIVDNAAAHRAVLQDSDQETRRAYLDSLKIRKQTAQRVFAEKHAKRLAEVGERRAMTDARTQERRTTSDDALGLSATGHTQSSKTLTDASVKSLAVTPTSSGPLVSAEAERMFEVEKPPTGPLCQILLNSGYFLTPGLRFGAQYSVYPGDPLRFHAHYMASQYQWNEEIPILDIVAGGRLATAVKKAFLIGGKRSDSASSLDAQVRTFSIEWAGM